MFKKFAGAHKTPRHSTAQTPVRKSPHPGGRKDGEGAGMMPGKASVIVQFFNEETGQIWSSPVAYY